jgi:rhodanese-related sulfurtransferase
VKRALALLLILSVLFAACGGNDDTVAESGSSAATDSGATDLPAGIRIVSANDGAAIQTDPPADLVVLDVRTPEEFAAGHLDGATMLDFYEPDFADRLAELDPDVPYLLYCRSGNRSGQTAQLMREFGFTDVAEIDGGIVAWDAAGLPTVGG